MSTGGGAQTTTTPAHIVTIHQRFFEGDDGNVDVLETGLAKIMEAAISTNNSPYYNEDAYSPDIDLLELKTQIVDYETYIDALEHESDWEGISDKALALVDESGSEVFPISGSFIDTLSNAVSEAISAATTAMAESAVTDDVDAYDTRADTRAANRITQMAAGMADINAVHSSAFAQAEAMILNEVQQDVNKYEKELKLNIFRGVFDPAIKAQLDIIIKKNVARDQYILSATAEMSKLLMSKTQGVGNIEQFYKEYYMGKIVAKKEQKREQLEIDVNDAMWDFTIYQAGANVLASAAGAAVTSGREMTPAQSAMSGALSGAAVGAMTGNPLVALAGAGLGLIGGLLSS